MDGFNPHGISVRPEINLMVTSDFICPSTTLHVMPGGLDLRGSVRVWDFQNRRILRTINIPNPAGTIDVKLIPGDEKARAFTAGMTDDQLYLIDTRRGSATSVFDFSTIAKGGWPQLMRMTKDGKKLFISMNMAGKSVMFDNSDSQKAKVLEGRSGERRVGEEGRSRGWADHLKKKKKNCMCEVAMTSEDRCSLPVLAASCEDSYCEQSVQWTL